MSDRNARPTRHSRSQRLTNALLKAATSTFQAWHTREPKLVFAGNQMCEDPKTGLSEFGPAALDGAPRTAIRVGVIGSGDAIQMLRNWVDLARNRIYPGLNSKGKPFDPFFAASFPGFSNSSSFECDIEFDSQWMVTLTEREISNILNRGEFSGRVQAAVELVSDRLCVLADKEPSPDVVVLAMSKELEVGIGPPARAEQARPLRLTRLQKKERQKLEADKKAGQRLLAFASEPEEVVLQNRFRDFHNSVKAHAMKSRLATQLVWHSTLIGSGKKEDPATTAWNFFTAIYYKAGNVPWTLQFSTQRTCFVGITFYRESSDPDAATRTCLAQAFSESGEGLVLRGERVTWDKERDRKPHLSGAASESILTRVLELYEDHFHGKPNRVVVHKTSRYWPEEIDGFRAALDSVHSYDFLALEHRGLRFLRLGKEPPIRGTVIQLGQRNYLVYTQGYVPFLRQYPGMRIPNPLEVVEHHGDSSAERYARSTASSTTPWATCTTSRPCTVLDVVVPS